MNDLVAFIKEIHFYWAKRLAWQNMEIETYGKPKCPEYYAEVKASYDVCEHIMNHYYESHPDPSRVSE